MSWIRKKILIPKTFNPQKRKEIASAIINLIQEKSFDGIDWKGKPFPKYSKKYIEFKGSDKVDLTLSGEMLDELKLISDKSGELLIGFDRDSEMNGRAEGNILGSYGGEPNKKKARDFLGITDFELEDIVSTYESDDIETDSGMVGLTREEIRKITEDLINESIGDL